MAGARYDAKTSCFVRESSRKNRGYTTATPTLAGRHLRKQNKGSNGCESSTSTGWHAQGRLRPDLGRQARTMGGQRPALRRLGGLPRQGLPGRTGPALRVAVQRVVRAGDPAVRGRWPDLGGGRQ